MSNLIKFVQSQIEKKQNNDIEQTCINAIDTKLFYQFMYKQLESAVEEILIKYPDDPVVNELRANLVRNLKPILEIMLGNQ